MHRILVLLLLNGCALSNEPASSDGDGLTEPPSTSTAHPAADSIVGQIEWVFDAAAHPEPDPVPGPIEDCVSHCTARADGSVGGGCPFETRPESGNCVERCEGIRRQSPEAQEAFLWCLENDPLCFQGIGECIIPRMYPEEIPVNVVLDGHGFTDVEGHPIRAAFTVGRDEHVVFSTVVEDGAFEMSWSQPLPTWLYHAWIFDYLYVDVNGNGQCDAEADLMGSFRLRQTGDFDHVTLVGTAEPRLRSIPTACDAFNR